MFRVAVLGHSLVPRDFDVPEGIDLKVFRKPGATWLDYNCETFRGFREGQFDLVVILLGGNDIAQVEASTAFARAKSFVNRACQQARVVRVYTAESRDFPNSGLFGISNTVYRTRRNRYNKLLRRWLKATGRLTVDIGRPWIINERSRDGVHLNQVGTYNLMRSIIRTVMGVKLAQAQGQS